MRAGCRPDVGSTRSTRRDRRRRPLTLLVPALVAQGIEHWFPEPCAGVRISPGALKSSAADWSAHVRPHRHDHDAAATGLRRFERRRARRPDRAGVRSCRRPDQRRARRWPSGSAPTRATSPSRSSTRVCSPMSRATLEIAGPGFINVTFSPAFLAEQLVARRRRRPARRSAPRPPTKTVVVDYSAPNVAKEMHAGHLRTTVIGDALVRMFAFLDHDGDPGEPHRRLGTPVRHADRAPPRHRRGRRRRRSASGRPRRLLQAGEREVHRVGGVPGARPRAGRAAAEP